MKRTKTVLIIDSGGRGSVLAETYKRSNSVKKVLAIPGNDFMKFVQKVKTFPHLKTTDIQEIVKIAKNEKVDLVDVAQDDAIAAGLVDALSRANINVFGPTKRAGQIEWDKSWSRNFMRKLNLPIPIYKSFNSQKAGVNFIKNQPNGKWYVKASGLAAGKGAIFAQSNKDAAGAIFEMSKFGKAGKKYLIEECLEGEEFSAFAIVKGKKFQIVGYAQDHKKVFDGDLGPNTGGMGCSSPPRIINKRIESQIKSIFKKTAEGLVKLERPYIGILYLGGIVDQESKVKIIEFNARWGDPEAQVILPSIKNDLYQLVTQTLLYKPIVVRRDNKYRIAVAVTTKGYPGGYSKNIGKKIHLFGSMTKAVNIYGAGLKKSNGNWLTSGGRLFYVLGQGKNVDQARKMAYNALSLVSTSSGNLHYRKDIGYRDVKRA